MSEIGTFAGLQVTFAGIVGHDCPSSPGLKFSNWGLKFKLGLKNYCAKPHLEVYHDSKTYCAHFLLKPDLKFLNWDLKF